MASSIYVYDNMKEFERFYKGFLTEPMKKINIVDMYINDKSKLWIVTNTNQEKERPRLQKSLVHFRNGNIYGYQNDKTVLILHDKIVNATEFSTRKAIGLLIAVCLIFSIGFPMCRYFPRCRHSIFEIEQTSRKDARAPEKPLEIVPLPPVALCVI